MIKQKSIFPNSSNLPPLYPSNSRGLAVHYLETGVVEYSYAYINEEIPQSERLIKLNQIGISQMKILLQQDTPNFLDDKKGGGDE